MFESVLIPARVEIPVSGILMDKMTYSKLLKHLKESDLNSLKMAESMEAMGEGLTDATVACWIDMAVTQPHRLSSLCRLHRGLVSIIVFFNSQEGFNSLSSVLSETHQFDGEMFRLLSY